LPSNSAHCLASADYATQASAVVQFARPVPLPSRRERWARIRPMPAATGLAGKGSTSRLPSKLARVGRDAGQLALSRASRALAAGEPEKSASLICRTRSPDPFAGRLCVGSPIEVVHLLQQRRHSQHVVRNGR
jgi:hypothetical protein